MTSEFAGRVALVTGAAGAGIGQATARRLAQPDDLSAEQARALAAEGKTIALVTCSISLSKK